MANRRGWVEVVGARLDTDGTVALVLKTDNGKLAVSLLWEQWLMVGLLLVALKAELYGVVTESQHDGSVTAVEGRYRPVIDDKCGHDA